MVNMHNAIVHYTLYFPPLIMSLTPPPKPLLRRRNAVVLAVKKFRIQAKKCFFTYPQCPIPKEVALELLTDILAKYGGLQRYRICEEEHKDEAKHLHAYVQCREKISTKKCSFADLIWEGKTYHGNYQSCKNPDAVLQYCKKGENPNYIDNIEADLYPSLIETARTHGVKRAMSELCTRKPELFVREGKRIRTNLEMIAPPTVATVPKDFFFNVPPAAIQHWSNNPHHRSLWLLGPTQLGKTSFAVSCFDRPLLVSHIDQLKELTSEHDGIIFDDCSFNHWPRSSVLHILDLEQPRGINVKNNHVVIPKGMPRIFTSNVNIWPADDPAIRRRIIGCVIGHDMRLFRHPDPNIHGPAPFSPHDDMFHGTSSFSFSD